MQLAHCLTAGLTLVPFAKNDTALYFYNTKLAPGVSCSERVIKY